MVAALQSFTTLFILLGGVAGVAALFAVVWLARRCRDGGGAKDCGGITSATADKHQGLLNKGKDVDVVPVTGGGGGQRRGASPDDDGEVEVEVCAICKAGLGEAGWGGSRRLRQCGHAYHADCIRLWLQRKWICPVCRAGVAVPPTEIFDLMV